MGFYINPKGATKEEFLEAHGALLPHTPTTHRIEGDVVVCLIDNIGRDFTAAGICYTQNELERFHDRPGDHRPRKWYAVPEADLTPFMKGQEISA